MEFKVVTNDAGPDDEYGADSSYEIKAGAVLVVHHSTAYRAGNEPADTPARHINRITTYGPSAWLRIEESGPVVR
ncbi:MAG: hypothetical protein WCB04_09655 [Mycobacteriales bacterium]